MKILKYHSLKISSLVLIKFSLLTLTALTILTPDSFAGADSFDATLDAELERLVPMVGKVVAFASFLVGIAISLVSQNFKWLLGSLAISVVSGFGAPVLATLFSGSI